MDKKEKVSRDVMRQHILMASQGLRREYPCYRKGQAVFNYVDEFYGVARDVQFIDHVDCFYCDEDIDEFLDKVLDRLGYTDTKNG